MYQFGLASAVLFGFFLGLSYEPSPLTVISLTMGYILGLPFGFGFGRGYSMSRSGRLSDPRRFGYGGRKPGDDLDFRSHFVKFLFGFMIAVVVIASSAGTVHLIKGAWPSIPKELATVDATISVIIAVTITAAGAFAGGAIAATVLRSWSKLDARTGAQAQTPLDVVANDRRSGIGMVALSWLFVSIVAMAIQLFATRQPIMFGLLAGIGAIPCATAIFNTWVNYKLAHLWLVATNRLPWQLGEFLDQARRNGVLRQSGISYEFRHVRLQETLIDSFEVNQ
jgi:hypothetical protein